MKHRAGLNPEQERAVLCTEGPLLVLAGAGTGKTRVVTCRIAEIVARGVPPEAVCAMTFTNKAAREMRNRAVSLLPGKRPEGMVVSTFHSLGLRILREFGCHLGLPATVTIADQPDQLALVADALREAGVSRREVRPLDARFRFSLWKNAGHTRDDLIRDAEGPLEGALALAFGRYQEGLSRRGLLDFDDLILRSKELLEKVPRVLETLRDRWRYVLVDEYQDTSACQDRLIRLLAGGRQNLCVVGDDDQSIYGWRGALPERILRFSRDFPAATVVTLQENYRSTAPILRVANLLIACNLNRRQKRLVAQSRGGSPVILFVAEDERDEVNFVVSRILQLRLQEGLPYEQAAVLFRANSQCRPLEQAFRERRIPYRVVGTRSFFDRREIRDLLAYLRMAVNPEDDQAFMRVANTPPRGLGKNSLDRLAAWAAKGRKGLLWALEGRLSDLPLRARKGGQELLSLLQQMRETAALGGVAKALDELVEATAYRRHLEQASEDPLDLKRRLEAVDELLASAREAGRRGKGSLAALLDALALRDDDRDFSAEKPAAAVTLMTLHAAKGLEFSAVFIVGIEEGLLPHGKVLDQEDSEGPLASGVEEERRLFYVGLTRARRRLFLSRAVTRRSFGKETPRMASRFLEELGDASLQVLVSGREPAAGAETRQLWANAIKARLEAGES